jgi:poly(A) polymerase
VFYTLFARFPKFRAQCTTVVSTELEPKIYQRPDHCVSRSNIDPDALKIMYRLSRNGFKAYLVGGGVRDLLLGKKPKDFDIATDATPRQIKSLFRNSRIIGRRFKLVHVFYSGGKNIEVSTFRDISEEPSENVYGTAHTDARRRDITINALFYNAVDYTIIDYVGGMQDLKDGVIRVIGDPNIRFLEDPVRMLRVVRHAARTGFNVDSWCGQAVIDNKDLLTKASQVRVYDEFRKDLSSGYILESLRGFQKFGLLEILLPKFQILGTNFLEDGAHLPICLERIDSLARNGMSISTSVALATLFIKIEPHIVDESDQSYEISEIIRYAFDSLVVPRKEKDRIEDLVTAFKIASEAHENGTPIKRLPKMVDLSEVLMLFEIYFGEESAAWLKTQLNKSSNKKKRKK